MSGRRASADGIQRDNIPDSKPIPGVNQQDEHCPTGCPTGKKPRC